ncbi:MerR family transcriptional regulator [Photobacterium lutimaris]|uniref:MerR family transcriptional regulator n=1 Tax=Photobacterium lutimaris TaxID=388278 RepID=A0A2T3J270_9GAMM|nr:MerR family DNA-binding transcriptional regulator [Photobacterium lutimaris]PSU35172.1 MerR family transcriptional regulator [Photobacterium lutimaris]TDR77541.1 MerR family transcriptional regulator [Photobacterium lutimaris]
MRDADRQEDIYTISQLAEEFSLTLRSIRFYEDKGLITPTRKGNTRVYSRHDRARLILILRGKRLGFSLQEIQELFQLYDSGAQTPSQAHHMLNTIQSRQQQLRQQQADINRLMMELNAAERTCYQHLKKFD